MSSITFAHLLYKVLENLQYFRLFWLLRWQTVPSLSEQVKIDKYRWFHFDAGMHEF
jgi:hypothetical protein